MNIKGRRVGWLIKGGLAVAWAVGFYSPAGAHYYSSAWKSSSACSPHGASQSTGGSVFGGCYHEPYDYTWSRGFTCAAGTGCSKGLCGGKAVTGGESEQYTAGAQSSYPHSLSILGYGCK